ncbi:ZIP family transporter [Halostella salina]|uniref:hypothetical protein n=1 Tax=Halostella salina TaxID=1547897 RepID=UPI000EF84446|nr:hypothetical protein [Halostella salina]
MGSHVPTAGLLALGLAVLHAAAKHLRLTAVVPRSGWLSFGGGVSVAYVFVHVLPELSAGQAAIAATDHPVVDALAHHAYLIALAGFVLFYGLERYARTAKSDSGTDDPSDGGGPDSSVLWTHLLSYGLLNATIGYLLLGYAAEGRGAATFAVAMGFHFVVNDDGLRRHHAAGYDRWGRWVLAAAILAGWFLAAVVDLGHAASLSAYAFVGGGVVLNVIKEELPAERESRFGYFLAGAVTYAAVLVAL